MVIDVALPTEGTLLKFHRNGDVVLSVEAVYLDMLLASSQRSTRQTKVDEDDRLWWLPHFTALINRKYNTDFSDSEGWVIARTTSMAADHLKKSFESMQKSLQSTESILSNSQQNSEKDSTSTSIKSEPEESLRSEFANNL